MSVDVQLDGVVRSNDPVTLLWEQVSGPDDATFSETDILDPVVTLPEEGTYVFRLTADDGEFDESDTVTVVATGGTANVAPVANAGSDGVGTTSQLVQLTGTVTDDGFPTGGDLTAAWTQVSGSGTATFTDATDADTTVTFSKADTYQLKLTASDGQKSHSDTVSFVIAAAHGTRYAEATAVATPGSVALTEVEFRVDLSRLDATWWAGVTAGGVNIRVSDASGNLLPSHVLFVDTATSAGFLWYKRSASGSNGATRIWSGGGHTALEPSSGTYGLYNSIRDDCFAFYPYGQQFDFSRNLRHLTDVGTPVFAFAGPIGRSGTTAFGVGKYSRKLLTAEVNGALTLVATTNQTHAGASDQAYQVGLTRTAGGTINSSGVSISLSTRGTSEVGYASFSLGSGMINLSSGNPAASTWRQYAFVKSGDSAQQVFTNAAAVSGATFFPITGAGLDCIIVGAQPQFTPAGNAANTLGTSLVGIYTSALSNAYLQYWESMLNQVTFWGSWTTTVI